MNRVPVNATSSDWAFIGLRASYARSDVSAFWARIKQSSDNFSTPLFPSRYALTSPLHPWHLPSAPAPCQAIRMVYWREPCSEKA
jgi:hypothetical protein